MGIFTRFTDIINSNLINMLDKAEDPEKMVRLMIQEMEDTLVEVKSQAAKFIADQKTIERHIKELEEGQTKWQEKAELAVSKGRDDLAVSALEEKSKKEKTAEVMQEELVSLKDAVAKFKEDIELLEKKRAEALQRQKSIIVRKQAATSKMNIHRQVRKYDSTKAALKFEQFERDLDRLEGQAEALDMGKKGDLMDEFNKLENESAVAKELQKIKEKLGQK